MISPLFRVVLVALVYSTYKCSASQQDDHDSKQADMLTSNIAYKNIDNNLKHKMEPRTNVHKTNENTKVYYDKFNADDRVKFNVETMNDDIKKFDEIYTGDDDIKARNIELKAKNLEIHKRNIQRLNLVDRDSGGMRNYNEDSRHSKYMPRKRVKRSDSKCEEFTWDGKENSSIYHPHNKISQNKNYYNSTECTTVISASDGKAIVLTFIDFFHIEYHPECAYDYLEIRDGLYGYAKLLKTVCGHSFPPVITSTGPNLWLKFSSDDTIEYEGFHIDIKFVSSSTSHAIADSCYQNLTGSHGNIESASIKQDCLSKSTGALDVLWMITVPVGYKINLNFTTYALARPNECEENVVEVFGSILECNAILEHYCGSVANPVSTKGPEGSKGAKENKGNIMYVRLFASKAAKVSSSFNATFTAYRTLDPNKDEKCDAKKEFDCADNTCIDRSLKCDNYAHCRLKADEEKELCKTEKESMLSQPHIMVILVIFSLILSGMSFVFVFKCIKKLYQDHKIIKKHLQQSCEDRLDKIVESRLTLDPKRLQQESEPRASLERENHTNEMFKENRRFSQMEPSAAVIDFPETNLDGMDLDDPWRRDVESIPPNNYSNVYHEEKNIARNGRTKKSDLSKKEQSIRSRTTKGSDEKSERKEIRDASVGAPDTKESGCQTRESLFQAGTPNTETDSNKSSGIKGFTTFGYSGETTPKSPTPTAPPPQRSQVTIELLTQLPVHHESKPQKKISDRRPMSAETTRSAPDVIIVSKPIH